MLTGCGAILRNPSASHPALQVSLGHGHVQQSWRRKYLSGLGCHRTARWPEEARLTKACVFQPGFWTEVCCINVAGSVQTAHLRRFASLLSGFWIEQEEVVGRGPRSLETT